MACVNVSDSSKAVAGRSRQIAKVLMPSLLILMFVSLNAKSPFSYIIWLHFYFFIEKSEKKVKNVCSYMLKSVCVVIGEVKEKWPFIVFSPP